MAEKLMGRLRSILYPNDVLIGVSQNTITLQELLRQVFASFESEQTVLRGPKVTILPGGARHLMLILHELTMNAAAHGALSSANGIVFVDWSCDVDGIVINWREDNGPPTTTPVRTGFGSQLIKFCVTALGGKIKEAFAVDGFKCRIRLSGRCVLVESTP
jgi:two-component sensor histidine kinase